MRVVISHTIYIYNGVAVHAKRGPTAHVKADGHAHLAVALKHLHAANTSVEQVAKVRSLSLVQQFGGIQVGNIGSHGLLVSRAGNTGHHVHLSKG